MSKEALKLIEAAEKALAEAKKSLTAKTTAAAVNEPEEQEEEVAAGRTLYWGDGETTNLEEMDLKACKAFAKEQEVDLGTAKTLEAVRDAIYSAYEDYHVDPDADEAAEEEEAAEEDEISTVVVVVDGDGDEVEIDLADKDLKGLKAFAKEYDIALTMKDKDGIIAEILEVFNAEVEEGEEAGDQLTREELDEMTDAEIKSTCGELEIEPVTATKKIAGKNKQVFDREATIDAILEAAGVEEGEEEEQSPADQYGLNDMETEELANILSSYGLSPKGKREALIDRILENIESGKIEMDEEGN